MKKLLMLTTFLALCAPLATIARENDQDHGNRHAQIAQREGGDEDRGRGNGRGNAERRDERRDEGRNDEGRNYQRGRSFGQESFGENGRFGYRRDRDFQRRFSYGGRFYTAVRAPAFVYPRGWGYRRWAVGAFLPLTLVAAPYFVDWGWIGLPPPPPGYDWVRYGPDALMVNRFNGRILDVVYNVFY